MTAYALLRGIEYIYEECPYAVGSTTTYYKELLNQLETERPGTKLAFYVKFLEARKQACLANPSPARRRSYIRAQTAGSRPQCRDCARSVV